MPVTPFHFGVGLLGKGMAPRQLSLAAFVISQIVIDCETVYFLLIAREVPIHRWAHTFLVGSVVGLLAGLATSIVGTRLEPLFERRSFGSESALWPCLAGGLLGGFSHSILDGIMHTDIQPFRPFSRDNPLLGAVGLGALHVSCVLAAAMGLVLLARRRQARKPLP
jgi:membrane-bound metal-dependent hydrolase YbcI (DUF457 family)